MNDYQTLGHPPRINFLVTTDYANPMNYGGRSGGSTAASFTLHLEVALSPDEARDLGAALGVKQHEKAHSIVKKAMGRDAPPDDPKSNRCYAMVAAAFAHDQKE